MAGWYRAARDKGLAVRMVFAGDEESEVDALRAIMLAHVDHRVFGPEFDDGDIAVEPATQHMGLLNAEVVENHLQTLLGRIRAGTPVPG